MHEGLSIPRSALTVNSAIVIAKSWLVKSLDRLDTDLLELWIKFVVEHQVTLSIHKFICVSTMTPAAINMIPQSVIERVCLLGVAADPTPSIQKISFSTQIDLLRIEGISALS